MITFHRTESWLPDLENILRQEKVSLDCWDCYDHSSYLDKAITWFQGNTFQVFHGTRLSPVVLDEIKREGLVQGTLEKRIKNISTVLFDLNEQQKERVSQKAQMLSTPDRHGCKYFDGKIYFALSKKSFFQQGLGGEYILEGSEFDRAVIKNTLDVLYMRKYISRTQPYIISFEQDFRSVFGSRPGDNYKYVASLFLDIWAENQLEKNKIDESYFYVDCASGISGSIPRKKIIEIELVDISEVSLY